MLWWARSAPKLFDRIAEVDLFERIGRVSAAHRARYGCSVNERSMRRRRTRDYAMRDGAKKLSCGLCENF